jgi:Dirigent-like protein
MKTIMRLLAPILVSAVVLAGATAASAAPAHADLVFAAHQTKFTYIDNNNPGPGPGDVFIVRGYITQGNDNGARIGKFNVHCTLIDRGFRAECSATFIFGKGRNPDELSIDGRYNSHRTQNVFSVVGGTGQYRGATGVATMYQNNGHSRWFVRLGS